VVSIAAYGPKDQGFDNTHIRCALVPCESRRFEQLTTVNDTGHVAVLGRLFAHRGGA